MNVKKLSEFLINEGRYYRNGVFCNKFVPLMEGELISRDMVIAIINPLLDWVNPMIDSSTKTQIKLSLEEFAEKAQDYMYIHQDLHHGDRTCIMNQNNGDAILAMYINYTCRSIDLRLHSKDLIVKEWI